MVSGLLDKGTEGATMGTIFLIESERDVKGWIEEFLPQKSPKILKAILSDDRAAGSTGAEGTQGMIAADLEEVVRNFLKKGLNLDGHIHEQLISTIEKLLIGIVLEQERGNQVRTAKRLGMNRNTLRRKMTGLHITTRVVARLEGRY